MCKLPVRKLFLISHTCVTHLLALRLCVLNCTVFQHGYRERAAVMANWVARTFRKEDLDKGILDVAGTIRFTIKQ